MNILQYQPLARAHDLAIRQGELYEAMLIVGRCGASPELTEAEAQLGERMLKTQEAIVIACKEALGEGGMVDPEKLKSLAYWLDRTQDWDAWLTSDTLIACYDGSYSIFDRTCGEPLVRGIGQYTVLSWLTLNRPHVHGDTLGEVYSAYY